MEKLKITGTHISDDGKTKCIHYSDGVVIKEPLDNEIPDKCDKCKRTDVGITETDDGRHLCDDCWE